jgi:hypothetical protein
MEKPYQYKIPSKQDPDLNLDRLKNLNNPTDPIPLTGWIHGEEASDLEERFYRGVKNAGIDDEDIHYNVPVRVTSGMRQEEKRVDFMIDLGVMQPVEVDGYIGHHTSAQQGYDQVRETLLNAEFRKRGIHSLKRVKWWQVETQEMADVVARSIVT